MEQFKKKLEEIIDLDIKEINKNWNEDDIKKCEEKYMMKFPHDFAFYLQHYGNDYIRENYRFVPSIELPKKIKQTQFEIDSIYGLNNDENKIDDKINFYKDILPVGLFPIADLAGGDLVCMGMKANKQNNIYIWFHEMDGKNTFMVANSFKNFVENFKSIKTEKSNLNNVKLNMSDKLNAILNTNASKNMK